MINDRIINAQKQKDGKVVVSAMCFLIQSVIGH